MIVSKILMYRCEYNEKTLHMFVMDKNIWACVGDIFRILEIENINDQNDLFYYLKDNECYTYRDPKYHKYDLVKESGLYKLIFMIKDNKYVSQFWDWLRDEVILKMRGMILK